MRSELNWEIVTKKNQGLKLILDDIDAIYMATAYVGRV